MRRHACGFIRHCVKSRMRTCLTIAQLDATGIAARAQKKEETLGKRSHGQFWGTANGARHCAADRRPALGARVASAGRRDKPPKCLLPRSHATRLVDRE